MFYNYNNKKKMTSIAQLNFIRNSIENMSKFNQVEVLRILNKHKDITLNENKYGIHVNLSDLDETILSELSDYVQYVSNQEVSLKEAEKEKEQMKHAYFS